MRTIPRALASFRTLVNERGARLRELSFAELEKSGDAPAEEVTVQSRQATIAVIVERCGHDRLRVVVQGFMKAWLVPGAHVALDGFYKHRDGTVTVMPDDEFYDYD